MIAGSYDERAGSGRLQGNVAVITFAAGIAVHANPAVGQATAG